MRVSYQHSLRPSRPISCPIHWPRTLPAEVGPFTHCHGTMAGDRRFADALSRLSEGHCPGAACTYRLMRGDDGWAYCFVQDIQFQLRHDCECDFPEGTTSTAIYFRVGADG